MARWRWPIIGALALLSALAVWSGILLMAPKATPSGPSFADGILQIQTKDHSYTLQVEAALTLKEQTRGLMYRASLPTGQGMIFIFPQAISAGFWMKNTKIPLSIAFFDANGIIIDILQMSPCTKDPCPAYTPKTTPYRAALEVNQGWFEVHQVQIGDSISYNGPGAENF